jgi:hypothetical protein
MNNSTFDKRLTAKIQKVKQLDKYMNILPKNIFISSCDDDYGYKIFFYKELAEIFKKSKFSFDIVKNSDDFEYGNSVSDSCFLSNVAKKFVVDYLSEDKENEKSIGNVND